MRLLNTRTLELKECFEGYESVPRYAILSHRWESKEVSFADWQSSDDKERRGEGGFRKIREFCEHALKGGYEYAWVDTCCINKESSAELSEAINSMFRWYAEAGVCYAYLCDVTRHNPDAEVTDQLKKSRWFTRGWTLQELIAPKTVVFYSAEWDELGTRDDLRTTIASITGIHPNALGASIGDILHSFSIAQRMSWAANRVTTRVEDKAYCLLGLFNINMPLLYGERNKAFTRLQELIVNESSDQTIFCWSDITVTKRRGRLSSQLRYYTNKPTNLLAPSPYFFKNCARIAQVPDITTRDVFKMTKLGLSITGPVHSLRTTDRFAGKGDHLIYLRCYDQKAPNHHLAIMVRDLGDDNFSRKNRTLCRLPSLAWEGTENKLIYIRKKSAVPSYRKILPIGKSLVFCLDANALGSSLKIAECWPAAQWLPSTSRLIAPIWHDKAVSINNWSWHAVLLLQVNTSAIALLSSEKWCSVSCMLVLGYDGIHDRCWSHLKPVTGDLEELWEQSIDTSNQRATYKLPNPKFNWNMEINLTDSPERQPIETTDRESKNSHSQKSYIIPVKIDIPTLTGTEAEISSASALRRSVLKLRGTEAEISSASALRRGVLKLTGKKSFASFVGYASTENNNIQQEGPLIIVSPPSS